MFPTATPQLSNRVRAEVQVGEVSEETTALDNVVSQLVREDLI